MVYTIEVRGDTAWITFQKGRLTLEGWQNAFNALLSNQGFYPGMACLWDARKASQGSLSAHDREVIARLVSERRHERGAGRTALVVSRDVDFGSARAFQQTFEGGVASHFRPFRDLDEAEEWLRAGSDQAETDTTT